VIYSVRSFTSARLVIEIDNKKLDGKSRVRPEAEVTAHVVRRGEAVDRDVDALTQRWCRDLLRSTGDRHSGSLAVERRRVSF
jgi:hypothetical protein